MQLRLLALVLYFRLLKKIFYPSHRDSLLYTHFSCTCVISIPYSIPTIQYFIPLSPFLSHQLSLSPRYSVLACVLRALGFQVHCAVGTLQAGLQARGAGARTLPRVVPGRLAVAVRIA